MLSVKNIFQERVNEIDNYYNFINGFVPTSTDENLNKILKSNLILMLYNLIESSVSNAIEEIHNNIYSNKISFDLLKIELKKALVKHLKNYINPHEFVISISDIAIDIVKKSFHKRKECIQRLDRRYRLIIS